MDPWELKRLELGDQHSFESSVEAKNARSFISTLRVNVQWCRSHDQHSYIMYPAMSGEVRHNCSFGHLK